MDNSCEGQGPDGAGVADDVRADPENTLSEEDIDEYESLLDQMAPVMSNPGARAPELAIVGMYLRKAWRSPN
ncbi:hypothetical protein BV898_10795 [Hypsibius exemplaris]|uniref:Uncharacterized protein n=1 Tax=Hypsibius exemplaris TaxID=2072580 RepID=A0A1W0WIM5_HYPEX|nr:hypothetical protein BV898_10795 [Hypsibius exemplaris]